MLELHELKTGLRVRGLVAAGDMTIVAVEAYGDGIVNVVYRSNEGHLGVTADTVLKPGGRAPWEN